MELPEPVWGSRAIPGVVLHAAAGVSTIKPRGVDEVWRATRPIRCDVPIRVCPLIPVDVFLR